MKTRAYRDNGVRYRFLLGVLFCYIPLAAGLGYWARQQGMLPGSLWPVCITLGMLCWTLIEYGLHRFVLHMPLQSVAVQRTLERLHLGHHREPRDEAKVTVPVYGSLPIAAALLGVFRLASGSWEGAALLMIGSIAGYLCYEAVHFCLHCSATGGRWLRWQRTNHFFHHFRDQRRCFGVTTPLWDWVFGTGRGELTPQARRVPHVGRRRTKEGMA
jgi:sterol desaturase/sphingolipid hydroxylase (fatty acid hydroxylase superfamily)